MLDVMTDKGHQSTYASLLERVLIWRLRPMLVLQGSSLLLVH